VHRPRTSKKTSTWRWPVICGVILLLACGLYFSLPAIKQAIDRQQTPLTVTLGSEATAQVNNSASETAATEVAIVAPVIAQEPYSVVEFWQLPDPIQKKIPALTFSFHVYSTNPDKRTIIINKRRVKQGDTVSEELVLEEITQQGVILQWQGLHRFTINVVENW
jgi:general secretion pathway protein B